ncbi:MAG: chlorophyll synthesis pathway protein BchC [Parvularculaceae bacterium]|nr:chlorophyll synthesis pathway protein BchC [Parvularculaceae bacterium]
MDETALEHQRSDFDLPDTDILHADLQVAAPVFAHAVLLQGDSKASVERLELLPANDDDVLVDVEVSGISTGTEKLFWSGVMPPFPGMAYPLVPGYETVGIVRHASNQPDLVGQRVFIAGARCYKSAHGLFGGAASTVRIAADKVYPVGDLKPEEAAMLSLAATALHALRGHQPPDLIVGFGVLGRLLRRLTLALGHPAPTVWEIDPSRCSDGAGLAIAPDDDPRRDYECIVDASGNDTIFNDLIARLARGGELVLAGFYPGDVQFRFAPAFIKEARLRIAAEWAAEDLEQLLDMIRSEHLSLSGLVTHQMVPTQADEAYRTAFTDPKCLKMLLDWRNFRG